MRFLFRYFRSSCLQTYMQPFYLSIFLLRVCVFVFYLFACSLFSFSVCLCVCLFGAVSCSYVLFCFPPSYLFFISVLYLSFLVLLFLHVDRMLYVFQIQELIGKSGLLKNAKTNQKHHTRTIRQNRKDRTTIINIVQKIRQSTTKHKNAAN